MIIIKVRTKIKYIDETIVRKENIFNRNKETKSKVFLLSKSIHSILRAK